MRRRSLLASVLTATATTGCVSPSRDRGHHSDDVIPAPATTESPLSTTTTPDRSDWLHADADCAAEANGSTGGDETVFTLGLGRAVPPSDSAVIEYGSLSPDLRTLVDFALEHGSAETCVYPLPDPLRRLVSRVDEAMGDSRERPDRLLIEKRGTYHEVGLRVSDPMFFDPG